MLQQTLQRLKPCRDTTDSLIYVNYGGVIAMTPGLAKILGGSGDAESTPFGDACTFLLIPFPSSSRS